MTSRIRIIAAALLLVVLASAGNFANAEDRHRRHRGGPFTSYGIVHLTEINAGLAWLFEGAEPTPIPYVAITASPLIGPNIQTGSILAQPETFEVLPDGIQFWGVAGPDPFTGVEGVHPIYTRRGTIHTTWRALFKVTFTEAGAVLTGDAWAPDSPTGFPQGFEVTGGTGIYRRATGRFRTFIWTDPLPFPPPDSAFAQGVQFDGFIRW